MGSSSASGNGGEASRPWQSYNTVFTNAKAGMDGVDKEKVQRIVYEMSKGSKFFEREQQKEAFIIKKIESMRTQCAKLTASDISHFQLVADKKIQELEATRDLSKVWLHVDMDAFYAAVETLANSSLKGKPLAVGSMSMISTANYEARKFGVRAAMPGFIARKLCPDLIFVPPDFKKYTHYSKLTRKVFERYDPCFIATSLDEAYLNITNACKERGVSGDEIAVELRNTICVETGLTCSGGVAPNRLLAKVCSDINKPNGQFVLPNDQMAVMTFISSLPIRKIGGIGKVTEHVLRDVLGIRTCGDMLQKRAFACALFTNCSAEFFLSVGLGLGGTDTPQPKTRKSISSERTFHATDDETLLFQRLADIAESLFDDIQKEGLCGRTLTLKLKTASFEVRTRAVTVQRYFHSREDIFTQASKLLKAELPLSVRLIGLRMSHFGDADRLQKTLTKFLVAEAVVSDATCGSDSPICETDMNTFKHDNEMCMPIDDKEMYLCEDGPHQFDNPHASVGPSDSAVCNEHLSTISNYEKQVGQGPLEGKLHQVVTTNLATNALEICETEGSQATSFSKQSEASKGEDMKNVDSHLDKVVCSSSREHFFWMDGYICSLCGTELPPSLVDERQEHSDFHLAEELQKEESMKSDSRFLMRKHRTNLNRENAQKKQKSSPKHIKHLPIDFFFVKGDKSL